jgi:hypothetical protein
MKVTNNTNGLLTSWSGCDIPPGETVDIDVGADEAEWLMRHGCSSPGESETSETKVKRKYVRRRRAE